MKHPISNEELAFLLETAKKSGMSKKDFKAFIRTKILEKEIKTHLNNKIKSLLK
ncbi:hypothetical protein [Metabacillus idriensis]|uniref:hypothetical protein n=1 Tax=Metabacillus idriensis TaxID=324768 RepID=UPI00163957D8|nr:hypothetical protein [Metabacillus idriensis]QNG58589.1 hypothetical protein H4O14_12100 [Bacillus sp. PAMC26568]